MIEQHRGDYDTAECYHRDSLKIAKKLGDRAGIAKSFAALGLLEQALGNADASKQHQAA